MARAIVHALGAALLSAAACNSVLGIEEAELDPFSDAGPGGVGGTFSAGPLVENGACDAEGTLACGNSATGSSNAVLFCSGHTLQKVYECPNSGKCVNGEKGAFVTCGTADLPLPVAKTGAPCGIDQGIACSFDDSVLLECTSGTWTELRHCAPSTCANTRTSSGTRQLACENGGFGLGDPCAFPTGAVVCSADLGALLQCDNGVTTVEEACTGGTRCQQVDNAYVCH
jgi:hypothetical protein